MTAWPFDPVPPLTFGCVIADPPWAFKAYSRKGEAKNPTAHYDCMDLDAIKALPVSHLVRDNAACIMWATAPMLPQAIETLKAWGFAFKTAGAWAKQSKTGNAWAFGTGYVFRSAAEFFVVGTTGRPEIKSRSIRNLIAAPVREHSRKPDHMHRMAEALFEGPYIELFARESRPGWTTWGNQREKFNQEEAA